MNTTKSYGGSMVAVLVLAGMTGCKSTQPTPPEPEAISQQSGLTQLANARGDAAGGASSGRTASGGRSTAGHQDADLRTDQPMTQRPAGAPLQPSEATSWISDSSDGSQPVPSPRMDDAMDASIIESIASPPAPTDADESTSLQPVGVEVVRASEPRGSNQSMTAPRLRSPALADAPSDSIRAQPLRLAAVIPGWSSQEPQSTPNGETSWPRTTEHGGTSGDGRGVRPTSPTFSDKDRGGEVITGGLIAQPQGLPSTDADPPPQIRLVSLMVVPDWSREDHAEPQVFRWPGGRAAQPAETASTKQEGLRILPGPTGGVPQAADRAFSLSTTRYTDLRIAATRLFSSADVVRWHLPPSPAAEGVQEAARRREEELDHVRTGRDDLRNAVFEWLLGDAGNEASR